MKLDQKGNPKGPVLGSSDCWYGAFRFLTDHLKPEPERKLLQRWNKKQRKFNTKDFSAEYINTITVEYYNILMYY